MNYRHAFHAGNFADLFKHAALLALLESLTQASAPPLQVLDTHAGAGLYDLDDGMAQRSGEARAGIGRLLAADDSPPVFDSLKAAVRAVNDGGAPRLYPGSPVLAVRALRPRDSYIGCEMRADDHGLLAQSLKAHGGARGAALRGDGYESAARLPPAVGRRLILIDPPFEAGDEYGAIIAATRSILRQDRRAIVAIWAPLKDFDTFDRFLRGLEDIDLPPTVIAEARLKPLHDPLAMNGCAMIVVNAPASLETDLAEAARWIVDTVGQAGGEARVWRIGG